MKNKMYPVDTIDMLTAPGETLTPISWCRSLADNYVQLCGGMMAPFFLAPNLPSHLPLVCGYVDDVAWRMRPDAE